MTSYKAIHRSDFLQSLVISGIMYLFQLIFSIFGFILVYANLAKFFDFLIGAGFLLPLLLIYYYEGVKEGERQFKKLNYKKINNSAQINLRDINYFKGLIYVIPFAIIALAFAAIAWISGNQTVQMTCYLVFMPVAKFSQAFGFLGTNTVVVEGKETLVYFMGGDTLFVMMAFYVVICVVIYWMGYALKIRQAKEQFSTFITEIVENERFLDR